MTQLAALLSDVQTAPTSISTICSALPTVRAQFCSPNSSRKILSNIFPGIGRSTGNIGVQRPDPPHCDEQLEKQVLE